MRKALPAALVALVLSAFGSARITAWGFNGHRFITERAIDVLPPELRPFFQANRAQVVEHSIDPDTYRTMGFVEEPPRHFLDMDAYGSFPFSNLPRDMKEAIAVRGQDFVTKNGTVPWRTEEVYGLLRNAFKELGTVGYARDNVKLFSSVIAHYIGDSHQPLHAAVNYDGQVTNQHGLHSRFESQLFERYRSSLRIRPTPMRLSKPPREFIFDTLIVSAGLVDPMLAADREAIGAGEVYDRAYYQRFFAKARPTLERRLSEAIAATAAVITHAWEEGGKPSLDEVPRPDRRKRQATTTP